MRLLPVIAALVLLASCQAIKRTTTTTTKQMDSSTTTAVHTQQDTASFSRMIFGKDVDITIKYFNGDQLRQFKDSFETATKDQIEGSMQAGHPMRGQTTTRVRWNGDFPPSSPLDFIPDHSRISEIDIHAADLSDSTTVSHESATRDSVGKREVIHTQQNQVVVEKIKAWWQLPVEIGCGLILLILLVLWLRRKFKIF